MFLLLGPVGTGPRQWVHPTEEQGLQFQNFSVVFSEHVVFEGNAYIIASILSKIYQHILGCGGGFFNRLSCDGRAPKGLVGFTD